MKIENRIDALHEWNRLARENAENAIVSSMFEAGLKSSGKVEQFSTWLLVGAAAIVSFLITNSDTLLPLVSSTGFLVCGLTLCLSCMAGLMSKIYALRCSIGIATNAALQQTLSEHVEKYDKEEVKIKETAKNLGITVETGIRMNRVLEEFYKPLPKIIIWVTKRTITKHQDNPQLGYIPLVSLFNRQGLFAILQSFFFLVFLLAGILFAAL